MRQLLRAEIRRLVRRDRGRKVRYGRAPQQFLELSRPRRGGPHPVVVAVHGGFWTNQYGLEFTRPLVRELMASGWAVANLEYRGSDTAGGGWPGTFDDVAAAVDALADVNGLDPDRVVALGHSAGGHLAVWLAGRHTLPAGAPGAGPRVRIAGAVSLAGVFDLAFAFADPVSGPRVLALMGGGPDDVPERYVVGSPMHHLPIGVPVTAVHSEEDDVTPLEGSRHYVDAARGAAGDPATFTEVAGNHYSIINPRTADWTACLAALNAIL